MYSTYFGPYEMQKSKINEKHWYRGINDKKTGIWYSGRLWHIGPISHDEETGIAIMVFETEDDCPDSSTDIRKLYNTGNDFEEDERLSIGKLPVQIQISFSR